MLIFMTTSRETQAIDFKVFICTQVIETLNIRQYYLR